MLVVMSKSGGITIQLYNICAVPVRAEHRELRIMLCKHMVFPTLVCSINALTALLRAVNTGVLISP